MDMDGSGFGKLVRAYRQQRGWTQEKLAERWGFTREYVSQIERGKRKLDRQEQVLRLADILGIPDERLTAIGKKNQLMTLAQRPLENDNALLQTLLEPAQNTIKMSWLIWHGDGMIIDVGASLRDLESRLTDVLGLYHGEFRISALRILGYTHEMLGQLAIERTATKEAILHFQEMYDIADELSDADMLALAMIHQSEMLRRRGWYETSFRRLHTVEKHVQEAPEKYMQQVSSWIQGVLWKAYAITSFVNGDEERFVRAVDHAEEIVQDTVSTIDTLCHEFNQVEILQVKAQGYTQLWQPEKALDIYKKTDSLRTFRPIRDQCSYAIIKAQAHCYVDDLQQGIKYAHEGLEMAESIQSLRYVIRLRQMSDRLSTTQIGKQRAMKELQKDIQATFQRMSQREESV